MKIEFNKLSSLQLFQLFRSGALFLASVAVARTVADRSVIGEYELLLLLGSSLTYFWVSGLINAFIPHYNTQDKERQKDLIYNVFLLLSGLSVVAFIILIAASVWAYDLPSEMYLPFALYTLFNAPAFLAEYILLVHSRSKGIAWLGASFAVLYLAAIALPLYAGYSIAASLHVLAVLGFLKFLLLVWLVRRYGSLHFSLHIIKPFMRLAWPLILSLVIGGSMMYIDSYMVKHFFSTADFALFQYGARELPFVLLMANALDNVFSGEIAFARGNDSMEDVFVRLRNSSGRLMHLLFPLSLGLLIFSTHIFEWVYGEAFIASAAIFNVYLLLIISRLLFPQSVLLGIQENKALLRISMGEWIINIVLNLVFLHLYGMIGIAYATLVAYCFEKAAQAMYLKKRGIRLFDYAPAKTWLTYSLLMLAAFLIVTFFI